jgi:probable HAF family extracellular repeat protein
VGQTFTDIPWYTDALVNSATDINDNGDVVGYALELFPGRYVAWIKHPGYPPQPLDRGTCTQTAANGINNLGDVVGWCDNRPALWTSPAASPVILKSLNAGDPTGVAMDIDDAGLMVGMTRSSANAIVAVYWSGPSSPFAMNGPPANPSRAVRTNTALSAVGRYGDGTTQHGFVWRFGGSPTLLSGPATGISDKGRVVGVTADENGRAFTVSPGSTTEALLPIPGTGTSDAHGVNTCGTVVGSYKSGSAAHAVMWTKPFCDQ